MRVAVSGARGRMGTAVCQAVSDADDLELVAAVDEGDELDELTDAGAEVVVDFTTPEAVSANVEWFLDHGLHAVVGTTGWDDDDLDRWRELSRASGAHAVVAPNFALGAVLMMHVSGIVSRYMPHVEIVELHHDGKADAPSGTALMTADVIARARDEDPSPVLGSGLEGARGADRRGIRVHSLRLPGLVAHQEVVFGAEGQTLAIRHDTTDRTAFMPGVLLAVRAVADRPGVTVGLDQVLGLGDGT